LYRDPRLESGFQSRCRACSKVSSRSEKGGSGTLDDRPLKLGKWGPEDKAGTVNLITPTKRKAAAGLVKEGINVSLSLDADLPKEGPTSGPPSGSAPPARGGNRTTWTMTSRPPGPQPKPLAAYVVDTISTSYHGSATTHLDVLSHLYFQGKLYNGYPQSSYTDRGAGKNDVMAFKEGIFTRGVLFDFPS
jgi:hypothetical protein